MNRVMPYNKVGGPISPYSPFSSQNYAQQKLYEDPTLEALQSRTLYFCRLPSDITDEKLRKLCEPFGDLKKCVTYPQKFMAFVEFYDIRAADKCRCGLKGHKLGEKTIDVQYSTPKIKDKDNNTGTLYVRPQTSDRNFVDPNSFDEYKDLFQKYGEGDVKKVSANRKRDVEKFIEFFDCRNALKAQEALNGFNFNGVILEVQFAQQPSRSLNKDSKAAEYRRERRSVPDGYGPYRNHPSNYNMDMQSPHAPAAAWMGAQNAYNLYPGMSSWNMYGNGRGWNGMGNGDSGYGNVMGKDGGGYNGNGPRGGYMNSLSNGGNSVYDNNMGGYSANGGGVAGSSPVGVAGASSYMNSPTGYGNVMANPYGGYINNSMDNSMFDYAAGYRGMNTAYASSMYTAANYGSGCGGGTVSGNRIDGVVMANCRDNRYNDEYQASLLAGGVGGAPGASPGSTPQNNNTNYAAAAN